MKKIEDKDLPKDVIETREMRRAFDEDQGRLYFDEDLKEDGFEYRVVNDKPGRVRYLQKLGYEIVSDSKIKLGSGTLDESGSLGSAVELEVGIHMGSQKAVLMRISKEDYAERLKLKQAKVKMQTQGLMETGIETQYGSVNLGNNS